MSVFQPADILLPNNKLAMEKWAVIACDQFTSQPEYWQETRRIAGDAPSTLNLILPEAELGVDDAARAAQINRTMQQYTEEGIFTEYPASYVYVERGLNDGSLRCGLVGALDLEAYDYTPQAQTAVRATERTVVERIPPRQAVRRGAPLELPHILLLCDDRENRILAAAAACKASAPVAYDFDLMQGGGHITGWLLEGENAAAVSAAIEAYTAASEERYAGCAGDALLYAVGDGNHSLATAKACWEETKAQLGDGERAGHPARYALVELGNIHEESLHFEAIHRLLTHTDATALLSAAEAEICAPDGIPVEWRAGDRSGILHLDRSKGAMAVGILQTWLDARLKDFGGEIDYIHGDDTVRELASVDGAVAFLLPAMEKGDLFPGIMSDGVLPRKTFSMGHANEKRYYLEARRIVR